ERLPDPRAAVAAERRDAGRAATRGYSRTAYRNTRVPAAGRVGVLPPPRSMARPPRSVNEQKWDAIAEEFAAGRAVPANGWEKWGEQAAIEATIIRGIFPRSVETLVGVGSGLGRLTPFLALVFPHVMAVDTSSGCRTVTAGRCAERPNVTVHSPPPPPADAAAALVWNLYDADWSRAEIAE